jgi:hypothetical protein
MEFRRWVVSRSELREPGSKIGRTQARVFKHACQHARPDFFAVVECKHDSERDPDRRCLPLAMFRLLGDHAQRQYFCLRESFVAAGSIGKNTRQLRHFCQSAAVGFLFGFESEVHACSVVIGATSARASRMAF